MKQKNKFWFLKEPVSEMFKKRTISFFNLIYGSMKNLEPFHWTEGSL